MTQGKQQCITGTSIEWQTPNPAFQAKVNLKLSSGEEELCLQRPCEVETGSHGKSSDEGRREEVRLGGGQG